MLRYKVLCLLGGLGGLSCSSTPSTSIIVQVNGDLEESEVSDIFIRVGEVGVDGPIRLKCMGRMPFSVEIQATSDTENAQKPVRVSAEALHEGKSLLTAVAETNFKKEATLRLDLNLYRSCMSAQCDNITSSCGASGTCEPLQRNQLPEFKSSSLGKTQYCSVADDSSGVGGAGGASGGDGGVGGGGVGGGGVGGGGTGGIGPNPTDECTGSGVTLECADPALPVCVSGRCTTSPELRGLGPSVLQSLALRPVIQEVLVGMNNDDYLKRRDELNNARYHNFAIGVSRMPSGTIRYSSGFVLDTFNRDHHAFRNATSATYNGYLQTYPEHRVYDVVAHNTSSTATSLRYSIIQVKDATPLNIDRAVLRDKTIDEINAKITEQDLVGLFPLRIHGYATSASTLYSVVFTDNASNKEFLTALNKDASEFTNEATFNAAAGYHLTDISAYPDKTAVRFTGVFAKVPGYGSWSSHNLKPEEFDRKHAELVSQDYMLNDVEYYSAALDKDEGRIAASWLRLNDESIESNVDLTNAALQQPLTELRSRLAGFGGHVGFVVEDLKSGNYLTFRGHDMFYAAELMDVFVAIKVLQAVDAGTLQLNSPLPVTEDDILTSKDEINTVGNYRLIELLKRMLGSQSVNARERLMRQVTPELVNGMLQTWGRNVGSVRGVCATDKVRFRLRHSCAESIACKDLENWVLDGVRKPQNEHTNLCIGALELVETKDPAHVEYEFAKLNSSYTNNVTPLEYARLFRHLFTDALSTHSRDLLIALLTRGADDPTTAQSAQFYGTLSALPGSYRKVENYAGLGYDVDPKLRTANSQFAFNVFTENWSSDTDKDREAAQALIRDVLTHAQTALLAARSSF